MRLHSFVFTRLLSFLPLCVINMRASMADRRRDEGRIEGRREGGRRREEGGGGRTEEGGRRRVLVLSSLILFPNRHN